MYSFLPASDDELPPFSTLIHVLMRGCFFACCWGTLYAFIYFVSLGAFYDDASMTVNENERLTRTTIVKRNNTNNGNTTEKNEDKKVPSERQVVATTMIVTIQSIISVFGTLFVIFTVHNRLYNDDEFGNRSSRTLAIFPFLQYDLPIDNNLTFILDISIGYFLYEISFEYLFDFNYMFLAHHLAYLSCAIPCRLYSHAWMFMTYMTLPAEITMAWFQLYLNASVYNLPLARRMSTVFLGLYAVIRMVIGTTMTLDFGLFVLESIIWGEKGGGGGFSWVNIVRIWSFTLCLGGIMASGLWLMEEFDRFVFCKNDANDGEENIGETKNKSHVE